MLWKLVGLCFLLLLLLLTSFLTPTYFPPVPAPAPTSKNDPNAASAPGKFEFAVQWGYKIRSLDLRKKWPGAGKQTHEGNARCLNLFYDNPNSGEVSRFICKGVTVFLSWMCLKYRINTIWLHPIYRPNVFKKYFFFN